MLKIVTIGGGSSYTPELIEGYIKRHIELPVSEIWLVDVEEGREKLEITGALARRMVTKADCDIKIVTTLDRRAALKNANFVTTQLRVGGQAARIRDERIPLKYGCIGQETTGAGGFAKALRTIPVILEVCKDMAELCPDAWLINFTNPAGIVTEAALTHSNIKTLGLCNVSIDMKNSFAKKYDCDVDNVYCDFVGLNHLLWMRKIFVHGEDKTSELIAEASERDEIMKNIPNIKMGAEFFNSIGMLPISYLKYYYLANEMLAECIRLSENEGVRGEIVKDLEADLFELYKDVNLNIKPEQLSKRGGAHYSDAACDLVNSIYNDKRDLHVVCIKNNGAYPDLPNDAVVERNCIVGVDGAVPLSAGHLPPQIRGLIQVVKAYEQLTVEAGVFGDRNAAIQALTTHPLIPSSTVAMELLDDLIKSNLEFLPQFR